MRVFVQLVSAVYVYCANMFVAIIVKTKKKIE